MKRFVWRLQRVLDIKEKSEQIKRAELLRLTEEIAGVRADVLDQEAILRDMAQAVAAAPKERRVADQALFMQFASVNQQRIDALRQEIRQLEIRQQEKVAELIEIRRSKEALERLRDQARQRYTREQDQIEQKELDDRAGLGFVRRQAEAPARR